MSFFGRDGTQKLALADFTSFLVSLHEEVVRLEFAHYDVAGRGSIPALDFARSLVATADVRHVDKLLDKVGARLKHETPCEASGRHRNVGQGA